MIYTDRVRPEWVDYNGHMSEAFYVLVFGYATDAVYDAIGLDDAFRTANAVSAYTVEAHIRYLREVPEGAGITVRSRICGYDDKRLLLLHEMAESSGLRVASDASQVPKKSLVATAEILAIHVQTEPTPKTTAFMPPIRDAIAARYRPLTENDPAPVAVGKGIQIPVPSAPGP